MLLARPLIRLILAPALALALSGCPSLTERAGLPPSVERAETLERGGDAAAAARVYEQLASQNSGAERNDLALRAARGYLAAHARAAAAAISVRDGFLTAYYQTRPQERPRVRVYDTGTQSVADALTLATRQGADFIVGPLTREEVAAAAEFPAQHAPLLALNFLPAE